MSTSHASNPKPGQGVVVITGTSRGIGYHLARRFLDDGHGVIGISRSETSIEHPRFKSISADISDWRNFYTWIEKLVKEPIVGLINNAGIHGPIGPFERTPIEAWGDAFNVNLFGAAALTQACIPVLRRNKGFIIFVSGGGSAFPRPNYSSYGVSKCAVVRLAEVLAAELAPDVLAYCIAPGPNRTQMQDEVLHSGETVLEENFVDFDYPERLCLFLAANQDPRFSGKFIHVKDDYVGWDEQQLSSDANTLRRMDTNVMTRMLGL